MNSVTDEGMPNLPKIAIGDMYSNGLNFHSNGSNFHLNGSNLRSNGSNFHWNGLNSDSNLCSKQGIGIEMLELE